MIDFEGSVPLYSQVAEWVRARIESGEFPVDRPIPSKLRLRQELEVSQGVIEHALRVLREQGYIQTVLGRGMFVNPRSQWRESGP